MITDSNVITGHLEISVLTAARANRASPLLAKMDFGVAAFDPPTTPRMCVDISKRAGQTRAYVVYLAFKRNWYCGCSPHFRYPGQCLLSQRKLFQLAMKTLMLRQRLMPWLLWSRSCISTHTMPV